MPCSDPALYTPWRIANGLGTETLTLSGLKQSSLYPELEEEGDEQVYSMQRGPLGVLGSRVIDSLGSSLNTGSLSLLIPFLTSAEKEMLRGWSRATPRAVLINVSSGGVFWYSEMTGKFKPEPFRFYGQQGFSLKLQLEVLGLYSGTF
jgi:hypothetical protein